MFLRDEPFDEWLRPRMHPPSDRKRLAGDSTGGRRLSRWGHTLLFGAILALIPALCDAQSAPVVGRPILFVPGYCDTADSWNSLGKAVINSAVSTGLYSTNAGQLNGDLPIQLYWDGVSAKLFPSGEDFLMTAAPSARFFSINFYADGAFQGSSINTTQVMEIPILNKADELAQVIRAITTLTHVKDVVIIAHSMGGLDARAYLENLAQSDASHDPTPYGQDIAKLITLDTPHSGAITSNWVSGLAAYGDFACFVAGTQDETDLDEGSVLVTSLNSQISAAPQDVAIAAIVSYTSPGLYLQDGDDGVVLKFEQSIAQVAPGQPNYYDHSNYLGDNPYPDNLLCNVPPVWVFTNSLAKEVATWPFHLLACLSEQPGTSPLIEAELGSSVLSGQSTSITVRATLNEAPWNQSLSYSVTGFSTAGSSITLLGNGPLPFTFFDGPSPTYYDIPPGVYTLNYEGGGPNAYYTVREGATQNLEVNYITGQNTWNLTFTLDFSASSTSQPTVATLSATVDGGSAQLQGTVNPNGASASAWFEWGTSATLGTSQNIGYQTAGAGNNRVSVSTLLAGLHPNTRYYYRTAASGSEGSTVLGSILSFTTLGTLSAPTLLAPGNGATGVGTPPTFSWSSVANASGYTILVATSASALPTAPAVDTCAGVGCVWSDEPTGSSDTAPQSTLAPSTRYYWEVQARSASQFGAWSAVESFTTSDLSGANNFSMQAVPTASVVNAGGAATFVINTSTTTGNPVTLTFAAINLPPGASAIFSSPSITSGGSSTLTVTVALSTPPGSYSVTVFGNGGPFTQAIPLSLTVNSLPSSGPIVTKTPSSLTFPAQIVLTPSTAQAVAVQNEGTAPLIISKVSFAGLGDFGIIQTPTFPVTVGPGSQTTFEVYFEPQATGARSGVMYVWDNASGSPHSIPLAGTGIVAPPTYGTIQVNLIVNGTPYPSYANFAIGGPTPFAADATGPFNVSPGSYTVSFTGTPGFLTLSNITPSATQSVTAGGLTTFNMNFTAPDDFYGPLFSASGGTGEQIVPAGAVATFGVSLPSPPPGNAPTPITLQVLGLPPGATQSFNPQPTEIPSTLTVSTASTAPPGAYTLSLTGTNSNGLPHPGSNTSTLVVTVPPSQPAELVSVSGSNAQGNGASSGYYTGGVSADGRYVVFPSSATNLTSNSPNGGIFMRDLQAGTTTLASLDLDGNPFASTYTPEISANGQYVVFAAAGSAGQSSIYVRDVQQGVTEREDVAAGGASANGTSWEPAISADGRFVAFTSEATNLVTGVASGVPLVYVRDRKSGQVALASAAGDGTPANQPSDSSAISADGRYVAFGSAATNLPQNMSGLFQAFIRDMQMGQTTLVSIAGDGSPANQAVNGSDSFGPLAISADGRFVAFASSATNLVLQATDGVSTHLFLRDMQLQQTTLVDTDSTGTPFGVYGLDAIWPSLSADGRFVAYDLYNQIFLRDMTSNQTQALSLASDGTSGNGNAVSPIISPSGSLIAFGSVANNLTSGDTNGVSDTFLVSNPLLGTPNVQSITLAPSSAQGGASITGSVTLSGPAPVGGANVAISGNNTAEQLPALVFVTAGATSATFAFDTSLVSSETVMTIVASYNGGSSVALLTLDPSPAISVNPPAGDFGSQSAGTASAAKSFSIQNVGTAPLALNSIGLASGQFFDISSNECSGSVAVGGSCTLSISFKPSQAGVASSDSLQINYGNPAIVQTVALSGYAPRVVLQSIAVTPVSPAVAKGIAKQFKASGAYSDGTTKNLTSKVTWVSATTTVATINAAGLATGAGVGTSDITASLGGVTSPVDVLKVNPATLQSIAVTPVNPAIAKGKTKQLTATGTYSDGTTKNLTSKVTWVSATTTVATINAAGLATGAGVGTSDITATVSGVTSPADVVTVTAQ
jgi:TolB protein